ncbi:MAG: DAHL domain-containing protein [Pseudomonadota bacterium]
MTTPHRRSLWGPMVIVTALLASVLVFLYARTRQYGESSYIENLALLRHVKQLDAQWELDVLKSKIGLNRHYDPLADSMVELNQLLRNFERGIGAQKHDESTGLAPGSAALRHAIDEKASLIERFKSNNAVLQNSLAFLPTAAQGLQESLAGTGAGEVSESRSVAARVNQLLLASMLYSQSASEDRGTEIQELLGAIDADKPSLGPHAREMLDLFAAHARTILREQKGVNELLLHIAAVPTAARVDAIHNALSAEQQRASARNQQDRAYLFVFSAVLLGLLLYAAVRLARSHAEINRVNRELQGANENLEQRVQARTQELRQAQSELLATARQAGMAEIATNVLHNVGNVLNSVNVSAGLVSAGVRAFKVQGLTRAVQMMDGHADDLGGFLTSDAKGKMLPGYLGQLAQVLVAEQQGMLGELSALTKNVDHIKEIIATQQAYAGRTRFVEPLRIHELLEDALRMSAAALARDQIVVVKELAAVPELPLDKGRILQILVNLIGNARQAMVEVTGRELRLTLRVELTQGGTLRVVVADNGTGIATEDLTRVFAHGFTTKKDGHGFGLHSAVIAAREMGGTLTAHSDGPGTGATFTLELPTKTAKTAKTEEVS